jgi:hypothetical protein
MHTQRACVQWEGHQLRPPLGPCARPAVVDDLLHVFGGRTSDTVRARLAEPRGGREGAGPCLCFGVREEAVHASLRDRVTPLLAIGCGWGARHGCSAPWLRRGRGRGWDAAGAAA